MEMMQCQSETDSYDQSELPPPKKLPKVLLPASCREDVTPDSHCGSEYDEKRMDEEIESHFQGSLSTVHVYNTEHEIIVGQRIFSIVYQGIFKLVWKKCPVGALVD